MKIEFIRHILVWIFQYKILPKFIEWFPSSMRTNGQKDDKNHKDIGRYSHLFCESTKTLKDLETLRFLNLAFLPRIYVCSKNQQNSHFLYYYFNLIIVSSTCFEHPSVHPQEDLHMQFYGISLCIHISSLIDGRMCLQHILPSIRLLIWMHKEIP